MTWILHLIINFSTIFRKKQGVLTPLPKDRPRSRTTRGNSDSRETKRDKVDDNEFNFDNHGHDGDEHKNGY